MQVSKFVTALISGFILSATPAMAVDMKQQISTNVSNITDHPTSSQPQQESSSILPQGIRRSRGYCQLVPPNTLDKTDFFYCRDSWGVTFHGYFVRNTNICSDLATASNLMESFNFCERGLEAGECKIYPSRIVTKNGKYCNNSSWLMTFQGYTIDNSCDSIEEAFSKMDQLCAP